MGSRIARGLPLFATVVFALAGSSLIVGVVYSSSKGGSYSEAIAGFMWFVGLLAVLVVVGREIGRLWAESVGDDPDEPEEESPHLVPSLTLLAAGVVVFGLGTLIEVI